MNSKIELGIGETLRARRRQRNLSIEILSQETRIQSRFLHALEDETWDVFPARVYLEGFLRKYALALGLEADELLGRLRELKDPAEKSVPFHQPRPAVMEGGVPGSRSVALLLFVAGVAVVAFVAYRTHDRNPSAGPSLRSIMVRRPAAASSAPSASARAFELRATKNSWVRVWVDERLRFEGVARAGVVKTWSGESGFRVRTEDPAAVVVLVDGQPLTALGEEFSWKPSLQSPEPPVVEPAPVAPPAPKPVFRPRPPAPPAVPGVPVAAPAPTAPPRPAPPAVPAEIPRTPAP
jgi:hypothetical protein